MPEQIGLKRLLLSRAQRFALDLSRLGTGFEPNKQERFVMFLENLSISLVARTIYWYVVPTRKYPPYGKECQLREYLPWFRNEDGDYGYLKKGLGGSILVCYQSDRQLGDMLNYSYSWKKAHDLSLNMRYQVKQRINQRRLDMALHDAKKQQEVHNEQNDAG